MDAPRESLLLSLKECFVYRVPPRTSMAGLRAQNWDIAHPVWSGSLKIKSRGEICSIQLEDKATGQVFAACNFSVDDCNDAVEPVIDSSRYYVLRIQNEAGQHAYIGMGFNDHPSTYDFKSTIADFQRKITQERELKNRPVNEVKLDLSLKEGQTIRVNSSNVTGRSFNLPQDDEEGGLGGFLPPPPSGTIKVQKSSAVMKFANTANQFQSQPQQQQVPQHQQQHQQQQELISTSSAAPSSTTSVAAPAVSDPFQSFVSAPASGSAPAAAFTFGSFSSSAPAPTPAPGPGPVPAQILSPSAPLGFGFSASPSPVASPSPFGLPSAPSPSSAPRPAGSDPFANLFSSAKSTF